MRNDKPNIVIAAGGTGGHFYPAIALARELESRCNILFAVKSNDSTANRLQTEKFGYIQVPAGPFFGQSPLRILRGMALNAAGVFQSLRFLGRFGADAVIGFGAYVSVPVVLAARLRGIPVFLHEQNVVPGWANRFNALFATRVAVSFAETEKFFPGKSLLTGNPVRSEIRPGDRSAARRSLGLREDRMTIFVFGGSGGARSVNAAVLASLEGLKDLSGRIQFLHLTGSSSESEIVSRGYREKGFSAQVLDYSDKMADCYSSADFAVCRSGATTVFELAATRTPAVLIPYPYATNDHQAKNARVLESLGAARVLLESPDLKEKLPEALRSLASDPAFLGTMRGAYARFPEELSEAPRKLAEMVLGEVKK
jgi:UDP-N-acetylglucosamine--N-acetylmuramyl-(pentapeptide) pyrophosphoryl-undecaprenol N-acetylglucosamine transferase